MSLIPIVEYEYPKLSPKWDYWILQIKIFDAFNIRPDTNDWFCGFKGSETMICVLSARQLTAIEIIKLDTVMADINSGLYPTSLSGFTVFQIRDVYDMWKTIETALGVKIRYVFANIPRRDYIELWISGTLTIAQKNDIKTYYAGLISEKTVM